MAQAHTSMNSVDLTFNIHAESQPQPTLNHLQDGYNLQYKWVATNHFMLGKKKKLQICLIYVIYVGCKMNFSWNKI